MSLQDQLLKAGLVDKKKAQKVKKQKNKQQYQQTKGKKAETDEAKVLAEKARQEQVERSRELNRQRQEEAEQKAIQAQIRQLISMNKIERGEGDVSYQFTDGTKVKSILVTPLLQQQLSKGQIAIARLEEDVFELIPKPVAEKIAQRDESRIVLLNKKDEASTDEDDDYYAQFEVPDDLMW